MYPNEIIWGLGMYEICIAVGFFLALLYFRIFADRVKLGATVQNICIIGAVVALVGGYGCAVLFQAVYNALEHGRFQITASTGATFYGGLIGGIAVFLAVYFIAGRILLKKGEAMQTLPVISRIAPGSIAVAHALGRIGCLFAGCCHGRVTNAWYGIYHAYIGQKAVPIQLYEAIFLLLLGALMTWRLLKGKKGNLMLYLALYAVWRFVIEYFRADERGATLVSFLSPSQLVAVLMFLIGGGFFLYGILRERRGDQHDA